jgi:hypothetical protein
VFAGVTLWPYAELYVAPEAISEQTLSRMTGLGGAVTNAELQRGGTPTPSAYLARAYVQQTIPLGGAVDDVASAPLALGKRRPRRRVVVSIGRFKVLDFFDRSSYSGDARRELMNASFLTYAAYDFNADREGYTYGAVAELYFDDWALRVGHTAPPQLPAGDALDLSFGVVNADESPGGKTYGDQIELEHHHAIAGRPGAVRVLAYRNVAYVGNFQDALVLYEGDPTVNDAAACAASSYAISVSMNRSAPALCDARGLNVKTGIGVAVEQDVTRDIGVFARAMIADGNTEFDSFSPADNSFAIGAFMRGRRWQRRDDYAALGFAASGISAEHAKFLEEGGIDSAIGDGQLTPAAESVGEAMYAAHLARSSWLSGDYQLIVDPAYNAARGPVHVFGARVHVDF